MRISPHRVPGCEPMSVVHHHHALTDHHVVVAHPHNDAGLDHDHEATVTFNVVTPYSCDFDVPCFSNVCPYAVIERPIPVLRSLDRGYI